MAKAIFPRSSANIKTWVLDKMAKDLNSSAPVEFSFLANAKGSLQLLGEDEHRGSESGSRNGGLGQIIMEGNSQQLVRIIPEEHTQQILR
ncbi:hypothetical protein RHSIM_Rhsim03G0022700 [Rhododendron simsii]|uniref:Uncharacterized protein n=1 Tax=Rhododendron simsii TaxID=118357 RepID=A0A834H8Y0_RHOSS|nr:hypothetical protein RHSIM_Rhsim03G0022700 [Rhododendron simsii]